MIDQEQIVAVTLRQVSTTIGDETVLLHLESGAYYALNRVGSIIWAELQSPVTIERLVDTLVTRFEVDRERCKADVLRVVAGLMEAGFVEINR